MFLFFFYQIKLYLWNRWIGDEDDKLAVKFILENIKWNGSRSNLDSFLAFSKNVQFKKIKKKKKLYLFQSNFEGEKKREGKNEIYIKFH